MLHDCLESAMLIMTGGNLSGASQPHKHLQLIPVEDDGPPIERLARKARIDFPGRPLRNVGMVILLTQINHRPSIRSELFALRKSCAEATDKSYIGYI